MYGVPKRPIHGVQERPMYGSLEGAMNAIYKVII